MISRNTILGVVAAILLVAAIALPIWNIWRNRPFMITAVVLIEPKTPIGISSTLPEPASPAYLATAEFRRAILDHPNVRDLGVVTQQKDPESWLHDRLEVKPDDDERLVIHIDLVGYERYESPSEMCSIVDAAMLIVQEHCTTNDLSFDILIPPSRLLGRHPP